jgi:hypothetical protein
MPSPEALGPLGAHLASVDGTSLRGQILFAGGSEVALVRPPRLLEVVRTPDSRAGVRVLDAVIDSWVAAEATQATNGGANPRFAGIYRDDEAWAEPVGLSAPGARVLIVGTGPMALITRRQLDSEGAATMSRPVPHADTAAVRARLAEAESELGGLDAVVVEVVEPGDETSHRTWSSIVADHQGLARRVAADGRWARATAEHSATTGRALRLVTLVDAATPAGRSRAQAAAQLARASHGATDGRVSAYAVSIERRDQRPAVTALAALLATDPRAGGLVGAELVVGDGWMGLRSHPTPAGSVVFGGPELPPWFDEALAEMAGVDAAMAELAEGAP